MGKVLRLAGFWAFIVLSACSSPAVEVATTHNDAGPCSNQVHIGRTLEIDANSAPLPSLLGRKEVILTFDDGPHARRTDDMLDLLNRHCIKAVFFLRGDNSLKRPKKVRRVFEEGHTVGGHSVKHDRLTELSFADAKADIDNSLDYIAAALPDPENDRPRLFRFPYLESNDMLSGYLKETGVVEVGANVQGKDWYHEYAVDIVVEVETRLKAQGNKGVILLHDPFDYTFEATTMLIDRLIAADYQFVTLKVAK